LNSASISDSNGENIFPLDNQPYFSPVSSGFTTIPSTAETHPRIATSLYPSGTAVDSPQEPLIRPTDVNPITDPSTNFELLTSSHIRPFPGNFQSDAFSVAANHPSWEDLLPHAPRTSITGGTFIGGNVNHIQRSGEPGGFQTWIHSIETDIP
jgi:hypothetical protein